MRLTVCSMAALAAGGLLTTTAAARPDAGISKKRSQLERQIQTVKSATARYHSIKRAQKDGYVRPPGPIAQTCVSSPAGGMGVHFENPRLMADNKLDIRRPEMLLYAPGKGGKLRLVGVEYFTSDADQDVATSDDRPTLFGRAFEGPMPGHHPAMGVHYDLHVWVHRRNPSGRFAQFNPRVKCPSS